MSKEMPVSAKGLADIAMSAGQLGIATSGISKFTGVVAKLGATTNVSADQAGEGMARIANIMGTAEKDYDRFGSAVLELGRKNAATESEILEFGLRIAGAGKQLDISLPKVLAFGTALASLGVNPEAGGTAITRTMIDMAQAVDVGGAKLEAFAKTAKMSVSEFSTLFKKDAAEAVVRFVEGLGDLKDGGESIFAALGDVELQNVRVRDSLLRLASAGDLLRKVLNQGEGAWQRNTDLQSAYGERVKTTSAQLEILKNTITDAAISLGNHMLPVINAIVSAITNLPSPVLEAGIAFTVLAAAAAASGLAIPKIAVGIKVTTAAIGQFIPALGALGTQIAIIKTLITTAGVQSIPIFIAAIGSAIVAIAPLALAIAAVAGAYYLLNKAWYNGGPAVDSIKAKNDELAKSIISLRLETEALNRAEEKRRKDRDNTPPPPTGGVEGRKQELAAAFAAGKIPSAPRIGFQGFSKPNPEDVSADDFILKSEEDRELLRQIILEKNKLSAERDNLRAQFRDSGNQDSDAGFDSSRIGKAINDTKALAGARANLAEVISRTNTIINEKDEGDPQGKNQSYSNALQRIAALKLVGEAEERDRQQMKEIVSASAEVMAARSALSSLERNSSASSEELSSAKARLTTAENNAAKAVSDGGSTLRNASSQMASHQVDVAALKDEYERLRLAALNAKNALWNERDQLRFRTDNETDAAGRGASDRGDSLRTQYSQGFSPSDSTQIASDAERFTQNQRSKAEETQSKIDTVFKKGADESLRRVERQRQELIEAYIQGGDASVTAVAISQANIHAKWNEVAVEIEAKLGISADAFRDAGEAILKKAEEVKAKLQADKDTEILKAFIGGGMNRVKAVQTEQSRLDVEWEKLVKSAADNHIAIGEDGRKIFDDIKKASKEATKETGNDLLTFMKARRLGMGLGMPSSAGSVPVTGGSIRAATGYHGTVTSPTQITVGERGPERIDITPMRKAAEGISIRPYDQYRWTNPEEADAAERGAGIEVTPYTPPPVGNANPTSMYSTGGLSALSIEQLAQVPAAVLAALGINRGGDIGAADAGRPFSEKFTTQQPETILSSENISPFRKAENERYERMKMSRGMFDDTPLGAGQAALMTVGSISAGVDRFTGAPIRGALQGGNPLVGAYRGFIDPEKNAQARNMIGIKNLSDRDLWGRVSYLPDDISLRDIGGLFGESLDLTTLMGGLGLAGKGGRAAIKGTTKDLLEQTAEKTAKAIKSASPTSLRAGTGPIVAEAAAKAGARAEEAAFRSAAKEAAEAATEAATKTTTKGGTKAVADAAATSLYMPGVPKSLRGAVTARLLGADSAVPTNDLLDIAKESLTKSLLDKGPEDLASLVKNNDWRALELMDLAREVNRRSSSLSSRPQRAVKPRAAIKPKSKPRSTVPSVITDYNRQARRADIEQGLNPSTRTSIDLASETSTTFDDSIRNNPVVPRAGSARQTFQDVLGIAKPAAPAPAPRPARRRPIRASKPVPLPPTPVITGPLRDPATGRFIKNEGIAGSITGPLNRDPKTGRFISAVKNFFKEEKGGVEYGFLANNREQQGILDSAIEEWGTTSKWKQAGYILPDGNLLDLSARGSYPYRIMDHQDVEQFLPHDWVLREESKGRLADPTGTFARETGAVRLSPESPGIELNQQEITADQLAKIQSIAASAFKEQRKAGKPLSFSIDALKSDFLRIKSESFSSIESMRNRLVELTTSFLKEDAASIEIGKLAPSIKSATSKEAIELARPIEVNTREGLEAFLKARSSSSRAENLSEHSIEDLVKSRVFLSPDRNVGYMLSPEGDLQNLFNNGSVRGAGRTALVDAIQNGALTLDAYTGHLTDLYAAHGFVGTGRVPFNREFAPAGWDYEKLGTPDIAFMAYKGGNRSTIGERAGSFAPYKPSKFVTEDWDLAKARSQAAAARYARSASRRLDPSEMERRSSVTSINGPIPGTNTGATGVPTGVHGELLAPSLASLRPVSAMEHVGLYRAAGGTGDILPPVPTSINPDRKGNRLRGVIEPQWRSMRNFLSERMNKWESQPKNYNPSIDYLDKLDLDRNAPPKAIKPNMGVMINSKEANPDTAMADIAKLKESLNKVYDPNSFRFIKEINLTKMEPNQDWQGMYHPIKRTSASDLPRSTGGSIDLAEGWNENTLLHEVGHSVYDHLPYNLKRRWIRRTQNRLPPIDITSEKWSRILHHPEDDAPLGRPAPTLYGETNDWEDFAETFALWRNAPKETQGFEELTRRSARELPLHGLSKTRMALMRQVDDWLKLPEAANGASMGGSGIRLPMASAGAAMHNSYKAGAMARGPGNAAIIGGEAGPEVVVGRDFDIIPMSKWNAMMPMAQAARGMSVSGGHASPLSTAGMSTSSTSDNSSRVVHIETLNVGVTPDGRVVDHKEAVKLLERVTFADR